MYKDQFFFTGCFLKEKSKTQIQAKNNAIAL